MKKIVFIATLIAIFTACTNDEIIPTTAVDKEACEVTFSVVIPQATVASRAFNDGTNVEINNLTLLLFDENGLLVAWQEAEKITQPSLADGDYKGTYKVTLGQTKDKRIIHFVANYSGSIASKGSENEILSALEVSGTEDAYWQRMEVDGITEEQPIGTVRLIRNFARITVTDKTGTGFLLGYKLANIPGRGTVAPYFRNEKGGFPVFTTENTENTEKPYDAFVDEGYYGVEPAENMTYTDGTKFTPDDKYVYERNHSADKVENPTFIIINGHYSGGNYFYRVDIAKNYKYYNLLRNFHYTLNITGVAGPGYATEEEAKNGASFNNIDVGLKVEEITDGTNKLKVTPTDVTVVNGTTELYIDYEYTGTGNTEVSCYFTSGKVIDKVENDESGNSRFKVTIPSYENGVEGGKQTETFTISADGLSRKVRITLINQFSLSEPEVTSPSLDEYVYSFNLPSGMVESMFPLELLVYEKTCSFTPASGEQLAVELINDPDTDKGTWAYKKVVKWTEYNPTAENPVACRFKANEEITEDKTFSVTNKTNKTYFADKAEATLKAPPISKLVLTNGAYGTGKTVTLTFNTNVSDGTFTFETDNLTQVSSTEEGGKRTVQFTTDTFAGTSTVKISLDGTLLGEISNTKRILAVGDGIIQIADPVGLLSSGEIQIFIDKQHTQQIASGTVAYKGKYYLNNIKETDTELSIDEYSTLYFYAKRISDPLVYEYTTEISATAFVDADAEKKVMLTFKKATSDL